MPHPKRTTQPRIMLYKQTREICLSIFLALKDQEFKGYQSQTTIFFEIIWTF
jgi:hypothetical protein